MRSSAAVIAVVYAGDSINLHTHKRIYVRIRISRCIVCNGPREMSRVFTSIVAQPAVLCATRMCARTVLFCRYYCVQSNVFYAVHTPVGRGGRLFDIHEFRTVFVGFLQVKTSEPCRRDSITLTIQRVTRLRLPCACGALLVVCENYKDKTRHAVSRHGRNYCKVESGGGAKGDWGFS